MSNLQKHVGRGTFTLIEEIDPQAEYTVEDIVEHVEGLHDDDRYFHHFVVDFLLNKIPASEGGFGD